MKVLLNIFHLNYGHTLGFYPQAWTLVPPFTTLGFYSQASTKKNSIINSTTWKYCSIAFKWVFTLEDAIHRLVDKTKLIVRRVKTVANTIFSGVICSTVRVKPNPVYVQIHSLYEDCWLAKPSHSNSHSKTKGFENKIVVCKYNIAQRPSAFSDLLVQIPIYSMTRSYYSISCCDIFLIPHVIELHRSKQTDVIVRSRVNV